MLVPNLRPKVVPHSGSRLLPPLIVRTRGRLVAGAPSLLCAQEDEARPSGPACRPRGHHPGHPRAVAPLPQRARLLALRLGTPAFLLPEPLCTQSQFNRRVRALELELRVLQRTFAGEIAEPSAVYRVLDTTLVPAIVRVRPSRKGHFFCGQATFGRSASKT
jgi:hypothetical protein